MKEQQGKRNAKSSGKQAGKFIAGGKTASKKPLIQIGRITSAMPAVFFPVRSEEPAALEKTAEKESPPSPVETTVSTDTVNAQNEKTAWYQYFIQRIQKGWLFFVLNLVGIVSAIIVGRMAVDRLFFLESGNYPLIHFETMAGELAPKIWFILNMPFVAWFTIFVATIASLVSSIVLMVLFWLPKEPEDVVRRQRNWQMYSLFIQIFAFIFLVINYFTSHGIN